MHEAILEKMSPAWPLQTPSFALEVLREAEWSLSWSFPLGGGFVEATETTPWPVWVSQPWQLHS